MREGYPRFDLIRRFFAGFIDGSIIFGLDFLFSRHLLDDRNLASYWADRYRFKLHYNGQDFGKTFTRDIFSRETLFNHDLLTQRVLFFAGLFLLFVMIYRAMSGTIGMRIMAIKHVSRFFSVPMKLGSSIYGALIVVLLFALWGHDISLFMNYFFGQHWLLWYPFAKFAAAAAFALWWLGFVMAQRLRLGHGSQSFFEQAAGLMTINTR